MSGFFRRPVDDALGAMGHVMAGRDVTPARGLLPMVIAMVVTWFIYVPIHELLHAYGCIWTGGEVTELFVQPHYGGTLLQRWFPWVVTGGDYAGQLTGFTDDNDWIYMATVFMPFVLSVLFGVPLLRWCAKGKHPWLIGVGIVLGLAPFYNLPGDYYEMASILITRVLTWLGGESGHPPLWVGLRHDDIYTLIPQIFTEPAELELDGRTSTTIFATLIAVSGIAFSVILAFFTYQMGDWVARVTVGPAKRFNFKTRSRGRKPSRPSPAGVS